jgi:citrate lyase beta subunit
VTETAAAILNLDYRGASTRLVGLTWGAEDLSADLGAEAYRNPDKSLTDPYRLARTLCLYSAAAARVQGCGIVCATAGLARPCGVGEPAHGRTSRPWHTAKRITIGKSQ